METYARRYHVDLSSIRFLLDGEIIADDATPEELFLETDDEIDVMRLCDLERIEARIKRQRNLYRYTVDA